MRNAEDLKDAIDSKIARIIDIVRTYSPPHLLSAAALASQFRSAEFTNWEEASFTQADFEYLASLVTALPPPVAPSLPTIGIVAELFSLLKAIRFEVSIFFVAAEESGAFAPGDREFARARLRFSMLTNTLHTRGDAYWPIAMELCARLFAPLESEIRDRLHFTASDLIAYIESISPALETRARDVPTWTTLCGAIATAQSTELPQNLDELILSFPEANNEIARAPAIFAITPANDTERAILESLSLTLGTNTGFLAHERWKAWPLGDSRIASNPFVYADGTYYAFGTMLMTSSLRGQLEDALERLDTPWFRRRYLKTRDYFCASEAARRLAKLFPNCVHEEAFYDVVEGTERHRCETDALVVRGGALLVVEAKAAAVTAPARRGSLLRIDRDLENVAFSALKQGDRVLRYIFSSASATFTDANGAMAVSVRRDEITDACVINVTLESIVPALSSLEAMANVDCRFLSIALPDLVVVLDILDSALLFLHYLHRRFALLASKYVEVVDELDLLMLYTINGLHLPSSTEKSNAVFLGSHTEELTRYYMDLSLGRAEAQRPKVRLPEMLRELLDLLECSRGEGAVRIALAILDGDGSARQKVADGLQQTLDAFDTDGRDHTVTIKIGPSVVVLHCGATAMPLRERAYFDSKYAKEDELLIASIIPPLKKRNCRTWALRRQPVRAWRSKPAQ